MSLEERADLVATVQETYALMGRALGTDVPYPVLEVAVRPEVMERLLTAELDPYVTDEEMLELLRVAYFDLVKTVLLLQRELLGEEGERYEPYLASAGLLGSGHAVKVGGFRRALGRLPGLRWVKKAFQWGNIILGSMGGVPVVGVLADPIRELKESVEAQGDEDQGR